MFGTRVLLGLKGSGSVGPMKKNVNPQKAVVPLCNECNGLFGKGLESPVAPIFWALEREEGLSDRDAELLVRWLWKFEGLQWGIFHDPNNETYTRIYTLRDRVTTSRAFNEIRSQLVLTVALARANDAGHKRLANGTRYASLRERRDDERRFPPRCFNFSLARFSDAIHPSFSRYTFGRAPVDRDAKVFPPPCTFLTARGAVAATQESNGLLAPLHDNLGRQMLRALATASENEQSLALILPSQKRIELPPM